VRKTKEKLNKEKVPHDWLEPNLTVPIPVKRHSILLLHRNIMASFTGKCKTFIFVFSYEEAIF